jgi:hypothetical protein
MRPAFLYHRVQTRTADPYRQAQPDLPAQALTLDATPEGDGRHATHLACR